ncbi:UNVERIFIED_CONTAM: hypothetical protein Sradi_3267600 [Sesamum radiatum]|uniref:Uncharacterized protein n=1 Tax=Sesamum radiatum TaxID=300843 RepID=A0AAW2R126_SESRA
MPRPEPKEETPVIVQPVEELLTLEFTSGDPRKLTKIGSKIDEAGCPRSSGQLSLQRTNTSLCGLPRTWRG